MSFTISRTSSPHTTFQEQADEVLAQLARQDYAAFASLYRRYVTRVYRYCFSQTGNSQDAEDCTSQTFLAALEQINRFRGQGSFAAWLFGIARRRCQEATGGPAPVVAGSITAGGWDDYPSMASYRERPTYELAVTLGSEPQTVAGYALASRATPDTTAAALAWAEAFGFTAPRAYTPMEEMANNIYVIDEDGERLNFFSEEGFGEIFYTNVAAEAPFNGEPIDAAETLVQAQAWWADHGFGPDQYRVELDPYSANFIAPDGVRSLLLKPLISGVPASGRAISGEMGINAAGVVVYARIPGYDLVPHEEIAVISPAAAYEAVVNGGRSINYLYQPTATHFPNSYEPLVLSAPGREHVAGERVTLPGWVSFWRSLTDNGYHAEFYDLDSDVTFTLAGPLVAEMAAAWPLTEISLTGTIERMSSERSGQLVVDAWEESIMVQQRLVECFVGELAEDGMLTTQTGLTLRLDDVATQLPAGTTVEACGEVADNDSLLWTHVTNLTNQPFPGEGGGPYIGPIYHNEVGPDQSGEVWTDVPVPLPDLAFGPQVPFELGEEVSLTGQVSGSAYISEDGAMRYELYLLTTVDDTPTGTFWGFRLYGEPELLAILAEHYYQFVVIEATVASGQDEAEVRNEPGLRVDSVMPVQSEPIRGHLGQVEFRDFAGTTFMVFIDSADGAEYAIDPYHSTEGEFQPEFSNENFSQIWMALAVHPYW